MQSQVERSKAKWGENINLSPTSDKTKANLHTKSLAEGNTWAYPRVKSVYLSSYCLTHIQLSSKNYEKWKKTRK
jgi:hypothetical protein